MELTCLLHVTYYSVFNLPEGEAKIKYEFLHTSFTLYWHKVSKEFQALCTGIIAIHGNKSSLSGSFYCMTDGTQLDRKFRQVAAVLTRRNGTMNGQVESSGQNDRRL